MGPVVFVLTLTILYTTGLVGASVCPKWSAEQHGDLFIKCCHLPKSVNKDSCRALSEEFSGDDGVELCVKTGTKSRERRCGWGVGCGSPPPPPPPPPPPGR